MTSAVTSESEKTSCMYLGRIWLITDFPQTGLVIVKGFGHPRDEPQHAGKSYLKIPAVSQVMHLRTLQTLAFLRILQLGLMDILAGLRLLHLRMLKMMRLLPFCLPPFRLIFAVPAKLLKPSSSTDKCTMLSYTWSLCRRCSANISQTLTL